MADQQTARPVADFGMQGDTSAVIPAEAYLGGWNVQVRALEAEVALLRQIVSAQAQVIAGTATTTDYLPESPGKVDIRAFVEGLSDG